MADITESLGIQNFYKAAITGGFARNYQFRVLRLGNWVSDFDQLLYITTTTMPGRSITPIPVPFMGLAFQVPGAATYNQNAGWPVTFRCDERLQVRNILESWSFGTFNDVSSKGANVPNDSIEHQVELVAIDNLGNPVKALTLYGAWVVNIGDMSYDLTGNGQVITMQTTLAYQYWRESRSTTNIFLRPPASPGDSEIYKNGEPGPAGQKIQSVVQSTTRNVVR
jgi:hypothetical protein